jgi:hypothetical protein
MSPSASLVPRGRVMKSMDRVSGKTTLAQIVAEAQKVGIAAYRRRAHH